MDDTRDRSRCYLVTVGAYADDPAGPHLAITKWFDRPGAWAHTYALCGLTVPQGELSPGTAAACPACVEQQPRLELVLANNPAALLKAYTTVLEKMPREVVAELAAVLARDPQLPAETTIKQAAARALQIPEES